MEYTIKDFRVGDVKDRNGNTWCNVVFEETGEPVTWVVKDPAKVTLGTKVNGEIKDWTASTGRVMQRFYREQSTGQPSPSGNKEEKFLKDVSNTPVVMYNGSLNYASQAGLNLIADKKDFDDYVAYVKRATEAVLNMVEEVRGTTPEQTTATDKPSLKENWEKVSKSPTGYDPFADVPPLEAYGDENA